jgi:hypothetical protein
LPVCRHTITGPRAGGPRRRDQLGERVAGAGVHVPGLEAQDGAVVERRQAVGPHATLAVDRHPHDAAPSQPQDRQRFEQADVHLVAHHHRQRGRREQAVLFDVPALAGEEGVAGGGQADQVPRGGSGHEPDAAGGG